MARIIEVECSGTPLEMGRQYGEQAREGIRENLDIFVRPSDAQAAARSAAMARSLLTKRLPEVLEELEGIAEGSRTDVDRLLLCNQDDTFGPEWLGQCTSLASSKGPDGPVLGKNNDASVEEDRVFVTRRSRPASGIPVIQVTYAGWLSGLDAMNAEGLANGHNSVGSAFNKSGPRIDIRLWTYRLMRTCKSTDEFLAGLMEASLTGKGFSIIAVDRAGRTAAVDAAVPLVAVRDQGAGFTFATNHYASEPLRSADKRTQRKKEISIYRYGYLEWRAETSPPESAEDMRSILSSHEPWAPCRHAGPHGSVTVWSIICLPRAGRMRVAPGSPCLHEFREYEVA